MTNNWQPSALNFGTIVTDADDVGQCLDFILATQKGSDPLRPTFGVDLAKYVDLPQNIAAPNLQKEMLYAVKTWEPRAEIKTITWTATAEGKLSFTVNWTSKIGDGVNKIII